MTNKEYIQVLASFINGLTLETNQINYILAEQDLNPDDDVATAEDRVKIKTAIYYQIPLVLAGLQNVQEGGYAISWNTDALKLWYSILAKQLGLEDELAPGFATIRDRSNRW